MKDQEQVGQKRLSDDELEAMFSGGIEGKTDEELNELTKNLDPCPVWREGRISGYRTPDYKKYPWMAKRAKDSYEKISSTTPHGSAQEATTHTERTVDNGTRMSYETGAQKELRRGKGRYDLISPLSISRIAKVYERGAEKYADRNWEQGIPISRLLDSALRHLFQFLEGDQSEDHLAQAAWNCMAMIHMEEQSLRGNVPSSVSDLPTYPIKGKAYRQRIDNSNQGILNSLGSVREL